MGSKRISPIVTQIWVVSWVLCGIMAQGVLLGFSSNLVAELKSPESPIQIDVYTESWLLGCIGMSAMVGNVLSTIVMHYFGRRWAYSLSLLPGTLGVVFLYCGSNVPELMIGRLLGGVTGGGVTTVGLVIIGEYASPQHRGMFLNLKTACVYLGCAIAHIMGNYLHWRTAALCFIVPHVLPLLTVFTWPESPSWLAYKERYDACEKSFYMLRGTDEEKELADIISARREKPLLTKKPKRIMGLAKKLTKKDLLKPLFVNFLCSILMEATGRHIFPSYGLQIIAQVTGDKSNSFYYTLLIDLIMTLSATGSSVLVKYMKMRTLLFFSGGMTALVLIALCPYLYLVSTNIVANNQTWLPVLMLVLYFVTANIGCVPIALGLQGETYPFKHRSVGLALTGIMMGSCMTIGLKAAPYMVLYLKIYGTLALLGGFMMISLILLYFQLPETKDKTLNEIEDYFNGRLGHAKDKDEIEENVKMLS